MIVFMPPLAPIPDEVLVDGQVVLPVFEQGYTLENTDLVIKFFNADGMAMSPFYLTYSVGFLSGEAPDQVYHVMGNDQRLPLEMRTGMYRPNLQIGDTWFTGLYQILVTYQVDEGSAPLTKNVEFIVTTAGIYDKVPLANEYYDIAATVIIV
jgi:hypothetical protein